MGEFHELRLTRFDFDAADFLASEDVAAMTAREVGQYVLLLAHAWVGGKDCTLPNDPKVLAKLARAPRGVSKRVMSKFANTVGHRLHNPRLTKEWKDALVRAQRRHEKAQNAANNRWDRNAPSMPQASSEHGASISASMLERCLEMPPSPSPIPSPTEAAPPIDQAKIQGAKPSAVEKEARLSLYGKAKKEKNGVPQWCVTPLHEEFYGGIYRKDIEDRFFDCRKLSFDEQVADCVNATVTMLATNRVRRFKEAQLDAREVETAALTKLAVGKQALSSVADFDFRRDETVKAVVRAVVEAAAKMIASRCEVRN